MRVWVVDFAPVPRFVKVFGNVHSDIYFRIQFEFEKNCTGFVCNIFDCYVYDI